MIFRTFFAFHIVIPAIIIVITSTIITASIYKDLNRTLVLWLFKPEDSWEHDFFIYELFPAPHFVHIGANEWRRVQINPTLSTQKFGPTYSHLKPRVIVYNVDSAGKDGKYAALYDILANDSSVVVLVHTSDEFGGANPTWKASRDWKKSLWKYGEGTKAYNSTPLVLRQFSVAPYRSHQFQGFHANVMQLQLGYIKKFLKYENMTLNSVEVSKNSSTIDADSRNLSWAFIGAIAQHHERPHMIEVFTEWLPQLVRTGGLQPQEMRDIYQRSKFVLVGRGFCSLDCFRIYEALICGALPVVVGHPYELAQTFEFEGDMPPLVRYQLVSFSLCYPFCTPF